MYAQLNDIDHQWLLCIHSILPSKRCSDIQKFLSYRNDGVKGFLSNRGQFSTFLELNNLKVWIAQADYLLAMKCLAMRIGEEFHDLDDVRYLLRYLNLTRYEDASNIITQYYPLEKFPQKTLYALQELLEND